MSEQWADMHDEPDFEVDYGAPKDEGPNAAMAENAVQGSALAEQDKDEEEKKGKSSALAEQPGDEEEEKGDGADDEEEGEPAHHKFNIGVFNWGSLRKYGEAMYARNVYNLPIFVGLTMEMTQEHVEQFEHPRDFWKPATKELPMQEPLQGFVPDDPHLVQKWISTTIFEGLAVVGRLSRVKALEVVDTWKICCAGGTSRLMMAKVIWRKPIGGNDSHLVIVGHLHNDLAKKPNASELKQFWDKLADLCAGGGRVIGMDANMAVFGVLPQMAQRGVGLTLLAHHMELKDPERTSGHELKWDTMGLWIVGALDIKRSHRLAPADHVFWGAAHPKCDDIARHDYQCGYVNHCLKWRPPFEFYGDVNELGSALAEPIDLEKEVDQVREQVVNYQPKDKRVTEIFGTAPWTPVEMPSWFLDKAERESVWKNTKIPFNPSGDVYTYMQHEDPQREMKLTDHLPMLPPCVEVMAQAFHWDPIGHRWGRGSHWPLLASIGTGRYRSVQMRKKRAQKKWDQQQARKQSGTALAVTLTPAPGTAQEVTLTPPWRSQSWGSQAWGSSAWGSQQWWPKE